MLASTWAAAALRRIEASDQEGRSRWDAREGLADLDHLDRHARAADEDGNRPTRCHPSRVAAYRERIAGIGPGRTVPSRQRA